MKKGYKSSWEHRIIKGLIWIIISLILLMLILVVCDRCSFHAQIYRVATSEVNTIEKQIKGYPDSVLIDSCRKSSIQLDTIARLRQISSSSNTSNSNEIRQTVTVNSNLDAKNQNIDFSSLFNLLKDVDGLFSANGITYLISLVVALLIALVTDRVGAMEELRVKINDEWVNKRESFDNSIKELEKVSSLHKHSANYDLILTRVESIFNIATIIGNFISEFSGEIDSKKSLKVGQLSSRFVLLFDKINDCFNNRAKRLDYMTQDEKDILYTYLDDALGELERGMPLLEKMKNHSLYIIIEDKIQLVREIKDMIDAVETLSEENR